MSKRKTYKNELNGFFKLSPLPSRKKYRHDTLKARPYPGVSVIHNIDNLSAKTLGLFDMANDFKNSLIESKLGDKVAFVNLDSFHATTFDLINEKRHSNDLTKKSFMYSTVRSKVEKTTIEFLNDMKVKISEEIKIERIGMFAKSGVIKLDLGMNENVKEKFQTYRVKLNEHLVDTVPGYKFIRNKDWYQTIAGHITFGYIVNTMNKGEIDVFLDKLEEFNKKFQPISFELTQGEVTEFKDMDNYSVV